MTGRLLGLLARLVPAGRRDAWLREWRAEAAWREGVGRRPGSVLLPAAEDAASLRLRGLSPGGAGSDLRFAVRSLLRAPLFSAVVIATVALAVGADVAIFGVVRGVLLRPLPYDAPERVALVSTGFRGDEALLSFPASGPEFLEIEAGVPAFEGLAGYWVSDVNVGGVESPMRVAAAAVTADALDVLGIEPALGRDFAEGEDRPGAEPVVLLTHGLWERAFAASPDVLGRTLLVDGLSRTVVGVLPEDFEFPDGRVELLRTLELDPADPGGRSSHWLQMIARLAPGWDPERAAEAAAGWVASSERADDHNLSDGHPVLVTGVREAASGDLERPLAVLAGAVLLVLLLACVNVANLLLARGDARRGELDVRAALGASRAALVRPALFESLVLAATGGALGCALAWLGFRALPSLAGDTLPPYTTLRLDGVVLLFALGVTGVAALLFGALPGLVAGRRARGPGADGRATEGGGRLAFRRLLVAAEVGMAVALVAVAGILGRGFVELVSVDAGFEPSGVVTADLQLNVATYPEVSDVAAFHAELDRRLEGAPGVVAVGAVRTLPFRGGGGWESIDVPGRTPPSDPAGFNWNVQYQTVGPGLFEALGVPVVAGRGFGPGDDAGAPPVAILNRAAVQELFGGDDPLGATLRLGRFEGNTNPAMTVVGVVGDVRQDGLDRDPPPQLYVPRAQAGANYGGMGTRFATVVVRSGAAPAETAALLRRTVAELDPGLPLAAVGTLETEVARSVGDRRFLALLMGFFSLLALVLGAVGLYGLLAYVVARRTREIGIRLALGADGSRIVRGVVGEAVGLAALGAAAGVGGALLAGDALRGLVYGVGPRDPVALLAAPAVLLAVSALAALVPARRASSVDPARTLRES